MNSKQEAQAYAYWLHCLPGIGDKTITGLLTAYGDPHTVYKRIRQGSRLEITAENGERRALLTQKQLTMAREYTLKWKVQEEYEKLGRSEILFYTRKDPEYPERLREIPDPPYGIFLKGKMPSDKVLSIAIIGARDCSEYGRYIAQELGRTLGGQGIQVISGMARGIDGISQAAALKAGGVSFGVLGCGVDICYPEGNRALYNRLIAEGGILSCYPPGTMPRACLFPPRNRIVSGLADAVIVVEARQQSGTLITVDMALEQGREVYVVPGRLTDRLSDGCNRLIRQGAGILLSPQDLLTEMEGLFPGLRPFSDRKKRNPKPDAGEQPDGQEEGEAQLLERQLLEGLDFSPKSIDQLRSCLKPQPSYQQAIQCLMKLCLTDQAVQAAPGYFLKKKP